ncbi:MAG: putative membrane protein [Saprospiraceae bacterium]|jgi:putative membrane protein
MTLFYLKALHIVGFVAWFAGLFYLVRIFVYYAEAGEKPEPDKSILQKQFNIMQWRVYKIICNPAMMITFIAGFGMLYVNPGYFSLGWMHIKLTLVFLLLAYHLYCKSVIKKLEKDDKLFTSFQFRLMNEVPTMFLVAIVLLAVMKSGLNSLYAFVGLIVFGLLLYVGTKLYKRSREAGE